MFSTSIVDYTYCYILNMPDRMGIDEETAELLRTQLKLESFYPKLTPEKVLQLFPKSGLYHFEAGEKVILQGSKARNVYILQSGRVKVIKKAGATSTELAVLEAPAMFGEIALVNPDGIRTADVVAVVSSSIYYLRVEDVGRIMQATAELGDHLMKLAWERLGKQGLSSGSEGQ